MENMKISEQDIIKAQELWAENIIKIGKLYLESKNLIVVYLLLLM